MFMRKKVWEQKYEFLLILLFLFMSVTACSRYTINFDEFFTMQWCRSSFPDFLHEVLHDTSPFLYYFMIRPFTILTGQNIFMARLFSLAALFILFLIGTGFVKNNFGKKAMFFYLGILYLNPFMLQKSTEIRMYLWATAFTLLSGVFCYLVLTAPTRKNWILFTLFSLLSAYTHYYAVLAMVFLYLGILIYYIGKRNAKQLKNWLICSLVTVLAYFPFLLIAIAQIKESNGNWISEPDSRLEPLKALFVSEIPYSEYFYLLLMAGFTLFSFIALIKKKHVVYYWSFICCSAIWGITAFGIVFGELVKPIMLSRYLIMPVCLLFLGLAPAVKHINKYLILLMLLIFALIGGMRYQSTLSSLKKNQTVHTLRFAEEQIKENDKIILVSGDDYLYNCSSYYIPQAELYYVGSFNAQLMLDDESHNEFWFFDSGNYLNQEELKNAGLVTEDFGEYQFDYLFFKIYRITKS